MSARTNGKRRRQCQQYVFPSRQTWYPISIEIRHSHGTGIFHIDGQRLLKAPSPFPASLPSPFSSIMEKPLAYVRPHLWPPELSTARSCLQSQLKSPTAMDTLHSVAHRRLMGGAVFQLKPVTSKAAAIPDGMLARSSDARQDTKANAKPEFIRRHFPCA
jgi:hypothetical protein